MQTERVTAEIVVEGTQQQIDIILDMIDEITKPAEIVWVAVGGVQVPILWFQDYFNGQT